jgi:hypothetical protein
MPTVVATPATLTWANYAVTSSRITDPADNQLVDAYTSFNWALQNLAPVNTAGVFTVPAAIQITITPNCQVWSGVTQTAGLLSHEQFHYDVGICCARAFAREIGTLRANSQANLVGRIQSAAMLHFTTRAGILQKRYDLDTRHGTNAHYQRIWKDRMAKALADNAATMGGFYF